MHFLPNGEVFNIFPIVTPFGGIIAAEPNSDTVL